MSCEGSLAQLLDYPDVGNDIFALASNIYPFCRSITGNGVRETLRHLRREVDLDVQEVPSGTQVFDWTIPREWNIRDAYIKNAKGDRIVDFQQSNLHVVSYSVPVNRRLSLAELRPHLHSLPDQPDLIPYRTSYYSENWGFCLPHRQLATLPDETYEVMIDSSLEAGSLTYGEYVHKGETDKEFLLSAHICHPSLADDNCSGLALLTFLAKEISKVRTRLTYRFLFAPGTIGAITWLARNEAHAHRIRHGLVISCVGDGGSGIYKKSRHGSAVIDRAMSHVLKHFWPSSRVVDFYPYGYDERQYCSPGFDLHVGLFQRSAFGKFPQYHTSADNLSFINPTSLAASYRVICAAIDIIENDRCYLNLQPKCEPQLGKRGLYTAIGGDKDAPHKSMAMLWVLNFSDRAHSLLDIAERANMPFSIVWHAAQLLEMNGLLSPIDGKQSEPQKNMQ